MSSHSGMINLAWMRVKVSFPLFSLMGMTGDVGSPVLIQIWAWLPLFFVVVLSRSDILELWVLPVAWGGVCFDGPIFLHG